MSTEEVSNELRLEDLVGEFILDGVDFETARIKKWGDQYEDCSTVRFRLDGVVYVALEDPDDGYRSALDKVYVQEDAGMTNAFAPIKVVGVHKTSRKPYPGASYECDIVEFVDSITGKTVLEVGTDNTDDYYPSYVANYNPQNMVTNQS